MKRNLVIVLVVMGLLFLAAALRANGISDSPAGSPAVPPGTPSITIGGGAGQPLAPPKGPSWIRVHRDSGKRLVLEIAARRYAPEKGKGPVIGLVGVVHIGDPGYYAAVQKLLSAYDLVLYECVKPSGAAAPEGKTDAQRRASTRRALRFLASFVTEYRKEKGSDPASFAELRAYVDKKDVRLADFVDLCLVDAWGHPVRFVSRLDQGKESTFRFVSYGADGKPGGKGADADLSVGTADHVPPFAMPKGDSLQRDLADVLRLKFQLDAIDYSGANWRACDMSMDQVRAAIKARGGDPNVLQGSLTGSSLSGAFARVALSFMKVGDLLTGGMVSDAMKAVMIEVLSDERLYDTSHGLFDVPTLRAIILDRNSYVIKNLKALLAEHVRAKSIAIFYGAGHMRNMAARLEKLGYAPVDEPATWLPAITVDLTRSHLSQQFLDRLRQSIRQRLRAAHGDLLQDRAQR